MNDGQSARRSGTISIGAHASARAIAPRAAVAPAIATARSLRARILQGAVLGLIAVVYAWFALTVRGARSFSGDEPHYLAYTQSLWLYHTIDQHNVLYHHDFLAYFGQGMSSHSVHRGAHLYPLHYPGLPLLLLPGFALAGAAGAQLTTVLIGVAVCWRALRVAARAAGVPAAALAVGVVGLSAPFVLNAAAIYPDLLSGLLIILAYEAADAPRFSRRRALALGAVLALCPWVHAKLLPVCAVVMAWAAFTLWRQRRSATPRDAATPARPLQAALCALGLPVISLAALMLFFWVYYGSPSPSAPYSGPTLLTGNPLDGVIGQTFAQAQGALGAAPFLLLALPGMVVLWRSQRATAIKILLMTVPFWLVTLTYRDWWGGDAAPLRYLLPMLPLWTVAIAALLSRIRSAPGRLAIAALAACTLAQTAVIPLAPRQGWPLSGGVNGLLLALGDRLHVPLTAYLPAFEPTRYGAGDWHGAALIVAWAAGLLLLWLALAFVERRVVHD